MVSKCYLVVPLALFAALGAAFAQDRAALGKPPASPPTATSQPTKPLTPELRADIFMARKMYREAIDYYLQAPQDSAVVWNKMGIAYHQLTELDAAMKRYRRAIKLDSHYAEAVNNLGTVYYAKKQYGQATRYYKRALKLSPQSASIYSNLGTAFFARKKYKEATEAYQTALRLDPDIFEHHSGFGVLLQENSVQERAKFHYYMAKTYAKAGQNERAMVCIRKALEEGFSERKKFLEEPEFATLRDTPEFKELLGREPRVL